MWTTSNDGDGDEADDEMRMRMGVRMKGGVEGRWRAREMLCKGMRGERKAERGRKR